jgi:hypothetical protein
MAEIKSAIELAMERTKGFVMDEKEKEKSLIQEAESRLKALVRRFLDGAVDMDDFRNHYNKIGLTENAKRALLVDVIVNGFDVGEDAKSFDLLQLTGRKLDNRLKAELDDLQGQFSESLEKKNGEVRKRILGRLKSIGIAGTALEPNLAAWDEWRQAAIETKQAFSSSLGKWKDEVKAVTV